MSDHGSYFFCPAFRNKAEANFHYKKKKIVLYSGDPAKNYHILKANGYYRVLEKYSDRKVDILYSPKYNEVMFV